jgi:Flp pilus assembly protein TadG
MNDQGRIMSRGKKNFWGNESGAVAVYAAIGLVVLLGSAALALDIAHMVSVKRELTKAAEAGALSGARGLWPPDLSATTLPYPWYNTREPYCDNGETMALATAKKNQVDGANLSTSEVTVEVGRWDYAAKTFTPGNNSSANGVRVTTLRNNVQMILAQFLGQGPRNMSATAVAIMDSASAVGKGCLPIAVNLDNAKVPGDDIYIGFNPDPEDNGGWFAVCPDNVNASTLKDYIKNDSVPPLHVGDKIDLQNGVVDSALKLLDDELALHTDGWVVFLPVVDTPKFNHTDQVDSFVAVKIPPGGVKASGNPKYVHATILALGLAEAALPGSNPPGVGPTGALAPPKLVQ